MSLQECDLRDGIKTKNYQLIKKSLQQGMNVNQPLSGYKYNALFLAIDFQHLEIVDYLIEKGADVDYEDRFYNCQTPLTFAIHKNSLNIVKLLIAKGANVNKIHLDGDTPLTHAVRLNKLRIVEYLLQQGANINQRGWKEKTPLLWAVTKNNLAAVQILLSSGADVYITDSEGNTALEVANKQSKNSEIADYLKNYKTANRGDSEVLVARTMLELDRISDCSSELSINQLDSEGFTPLLKAIECGNLDTVLYLLKAGADACKSGNDGLTPLLLALQRRDVEIIKSLLENGAEHTIHTAFLEAIVMRDAEIVELLIEHGALVNIIYKNGYTPLTKAIEDESLDIIKQLVGNGVNINMPDAAGNLPLALAVKTGNTEIVKYLIDNCLPPQSLLDNCPFLLKYIEESNFEMVEILINLGAKISAVFECGSTALSKAVEIENFKIIKYLVDKGADVNQCTANGKVPLAIGASKRNLRIVKFLIGAGANLDLARKEMNEFAKENEDLAIYLDVLTGKYMKWESNTSLQLSASFIVRISQTADLKKQFRDLLDFIKLCKIS